MREFTFGHARQLESVLREHLVALCGRVELLAWVLYAAIAHNLLRAAGTLAGGPTPSRGATLHRELVNIPARLARPQRRPDHAPAQPLALG